MGDAGAPMRKYWPGVVWTYRAFEPYAYAMMRIFAGAIFFSHGFARLFMTNPSYGFNPSVAWLTPTGVGLIEFVGGALLTLGLLTRPAALMLMLLWALFALGFTPASKGSWLMFGAFDRYPVTLMLLAFAFLMRGGGRYSLDRRVGREF